MLTTEQRHLFFEQGYIHLKDAFSQTDANLMQAVVWDTLAEKYGIDKSDSTTWPQSTIYKLQDLKQRAEFQSVGSNTVLSIINDFLGESRWKMPSNWGQFLVTFPETETWTVPVDWHLDFDFAPYTEPLSGLLMFSFLGDVAPRGGGTAVVQGSPQLVAQFMKSRPDLMQAKMKQRRLAFLKSHPWLEALSSEKMVSDRVAHFMDDNHLINGISTCVAELTGKPGDVVIAHPLLLHAKALNASRRPRFMLVQRIRRTE